MRPVITRHGIHQALIPIFLIFTFFSGRCFGQCSNWYITTTVNAASSCSANAGFTVNLAGPDAANITNLQYGIPLGANGYGVPLNNSNVFSNMPAGYFQVSAVGSCGGNIVGRNGNVFVPGAYMPPIAVGRLQKPAMICGTPGIVRISVDYGKMPYTIHLLNAPSTYTGPAAVTFSSLLYPLINLPGGSYTFQLTDSCGSGTVPFTTVVPTYNLANLTFSVQSQAYGTCDSVVFSKPVAYIGGTQYYSDTSIMAAVQIPGVTAPSAFETLDGWPFHMPLLPGKDIKDCYGKTIVYTIKRPCGNNVTVNDVFPYPLFNTFIEQHCNTDFKASFHFGANICYPVTYTFKNMATGQNYGPFVALADTASNASLPVGYYQMHFTTADGYISNPVFGTGVVTGNPYSVSVTPGSNGLQNRIGGFVFNTTAFNLGPRVIELFSAPAGYTWLGQWPGGSSQLNVSTNQSAGGNNLYFPAGSYVWKITDNCGTYLLPVTVGPEHLYQYTIGLRDSLATCNGKWYWPVGTATSNGFNMPFSFAVFDQNGYLYVDPITNSPHYYNQNDGVFVSVAGTYRVVPFSGSNVLSGALQFPNPYLAVDSFTYTLQPTRVDVNHTQGFICANGNPDGMIYVQGMGGVQFNSPPSPHYKYYLGLANSGSFFANNATGIFTNFGATANAQYDVRVEDSCGAFSTQTVKILDLSTTRLINSSNYVACAGNDVQLSTIYLPNATYSWTGPNGFTSGIRNPVIYNINPFNTGAYKVVITTTACSGILTDSSMVTVNGNPPKPNISLACLPAPAFINITNPSGGIQYEWSIGRLSGFYVNQIRQPDSANGIHAFYGHSSYRAIALDSNTGCTTYSDSITLIMNPVANFKPTIYSPHPGLCAGDTTTLVASPANALSYQWFKNGVAVPGATGQTYSVSTVGNYKVRVDGGLCSMDTSLAVSVTVVPIPIAFITSSATALCPGDTALIQAGTGTGYNYNWLRNNTSISGAFSSLYRAYTGGDYQVIVSNSGCARVSNLIHIIQNPGPVVILLPGQDQRICPGDSVIFATTYSAGYTYTWKRDGLVIPGAIGNRYAARTTGTYQVFVADSLCPHVPSVAVHVLVQPVSIFLGNDTTICTPGPFSIPLSVDAGFDQVLWSSGDTAHQINITSKGTYTVRGTNRCGTFTGSIRINTYEDFLPGLPDDTLVCNEQNKLFISIPSGLQQIQWSDGTSAQTITISSPGKYWVTAQSPCGPMTDTMNAHFCSPHVSDITLPPMGICAGDCMQPVPIVSNYPQSYNWQFPGGTPDSSTLAAPGFICYATAGTYPVKLVVQNAGGADTFSTSMIVHPVPVPRFKDTSVTVSYKHFIALPSCANATTVSWYKDGILLCANCPSINIEAKDYLATYVCVVSNGNCSDSCSYKMRVIDIPHDVWLPDAFTPNGDGHNDIFRIITDNPNVYAVDLYVYNRWGQQIYISHGMTDGWDGTNHGRQLDMGTYNWMLRYKVLGSDEVFFKKGDVQLLR